MNISFVGSGNVATHFAKAFLSTGHAIVQVCSQHFDHAQRLASLVAAEPIDNVANLSEVDVLVLSVPDNLLYSLPLLDVSPKTLLLHTSGSVPISVLSSRLCGVLWSPQSFVREAEMEYGNIPFCIEANSKEAYDRLMTLASSVSREVYTLDSSQRAWAHLACVFANNFGNALNAVAQQLLVSHDIPAQILMPIIQTTANRAASDDVWALQTGPASRQDTATMLQHQSMLQQFPEALQLYRFMSQLIATHKSSH